VGAYWRRPKMFDEETGTQAARLVLDTKGADL